MVSDGEGECAPATLSNSDMWHNVWEAFWPAR
eukprot:CAMPEP_0119318690 /NCGR_PEP_ID=MMETSP1333-20130426/47290_1 /TAXON_ID=418940 /ORGANISM="Scyphosphaera apsteinii, Strain RCC1455" /LENGTH=31 /DNA_ID= /DNA_START= /DNA_END= /DNA_ORIENTATION=